MRILFINNVSTEKCGVRAYGEQMVRALERAGDSVTVWDGTYSAVKAAGYLPDPLPPFDVVHLNWDPQAINHYLPEHFGPVIASGAGLSLFLHDVPPNSFCPVYDVAKWRFAFEPYRDVDVLAHAVPPTPTGLDPVAKDVTIGITGIRTDPGILLVAKICSDNGYVLATSAGHDGTRWLSTNDEIRRLARNTLNVCWYHTSGRGKSMAAMFCCAARRPLICSSSTMFSDLWPYEDEIYFPTEVGPERHLEQWAHDLPKLVDEVLRDISNGEELIPDRVCNELHWDRVIQRVRLRWRGFR